jgi:ribosomal protein S18 acetylase RimI-like enzyme
VDDLPTLGKTLGPDWFFENRYQMQERGDGVLLVARHGNAIVGTVFLWLAEAMEPEITNVLPGVPLIVHLEVDEAERNKGIGTEIMCCAEQMIRKRGFNRVALGVRVENEDAQRLYKRLGYEHWEHDPIPARKDPESGDHSDQPEIIHVLVKNL